MYNFAINSALGVVDWNIGWDFKILKSSNINKFN